MKRALGILFVAASLQIAPGANDEVWSIAQAGDFHAPAFSVTATASNLVPFILAHTNDGVFNFRGFISAGDCFQQDTTVHTPEEDGWPIASMTNDLNRLRTNGLFVLTCNGNHDCDYTNYVGNTNGYIEGQTCWANRASDTNRLWNSIFPIAFFSNQTTFVTTKDAGDSRNVVMAYTNGSIKLLLVTFSTLPLSCNPAVDYQPQTEWITNLARLYPEHNVIALAHFFLNGFLDLRYTDGPNAQFYPLGVTEQNIGPGAEPFLHGFLQTSNLLFCVGGHDRYLRKEHRFLRASDGHLIDVVGWNTQSNTNNVGFINIFTFRPRLGRVDISTYDIINNRALTNNDVSLLNNPGNGQPHNWTVPLAVPRQLTTFLIR
jgi:hypothetical protein